ncbi:MAG: prepilin-type N-terminal cleavage/methylation domain-containing protein [Planctomycetes bacterium]|nr:prepilin-type N-terminal cleavage/methylation domain-containing protein [Planctomycetota bacterium]
MPLRSKLVDRGYTLTELIVVFGIIALVATITIPAILPLTRGRHLRTSSAVGSAALMNLRMYAINRRVTGPCTFIQATPTDFTKIAGATDSYSYFETIMNGKTLPSELAQFVHVMPRRVRQDGVLGDTFPVSATTLGNRYTPFLFKADGSLTLEAGASAADQNAVAIRIYLVDLRSVRSSADWLAPADNIIKGDFNGNGNIDTNELGRGWVYRALEISKLTGRVRAIDPDKE